MFSWQVAPVPVHQSCRVRRGLMQFVLYCYSSSKDCRLTSIAKKIGFVGCRLFQRDSSQLIVKMLNRIVYLCLEHTVMYNRSQFA